MEFHQVRYFLAVCRTLNFSRAAEECDVSQPSLSRAIKLLEDELGGELFRRERSLTHMTPLGVAVMPKLKQCFESTMAARTTAKAFFKEGQAPLRLAVARSIGIEKMTPMLAQVTKAFPRIEIKLARGTPREIVERLKSGDAEIAIAGPLGGEWDRLDARGLFDEPFGLVMHRRHPLASQSCILPEHLQHERLLCRPDCHIAETLLNELTAAGVRDIGFHEAPQLEDLLSMVRADLGIGILPISERIDEDLVVSDVRGIALRRQISVYTVAGRPHTPAASTLTMLLRANQWVDVEAVSAQWSKQAVGQ